MLIEVFSGITRTYTWFLPYIAADEHGEVIGIAAHLVTWEFKLKPQFWI